MMRRCEEQSKLSIWQQDFGFETEFANLISDSQHAKVKWMLPRLLLPAFSKVAENRRSQEARSFAAQIAITQDPYIGKPISYEFRDGMPVVWTVPRASSRPIQRSSEPQESPNEWISFSGEGKIKH